MFYLCLAVSSEPLIEEVGNLINSSINWVAQPVQDHPNHLLFQICWTKMRGEGINLDRVKYFFKNNRPRVVNVKELEGPAYFILKPGLWWWSWWWIQIHRSKIFWWQRWWILLERPTNSTRMIMTIMLSYLTAPTIKIMIIMIIYLTAPTNSMVNINSMKPIVPLLSLSKTLNRFDQHQITIIIIVNIVTLF